MKNKSGIISALVLSLAIAGSAFAVTQTQDKGASGSASSTKMQSTAKMSGKKTKSRKHHKAKHAKMMKSSKKTASSTKK